MGLYSRRQNSNPLPPTISLPPPFHTRHESSPTPPLPISPPPSTNINRRDSLPPAFPPLSPPSIASHSRRDSYPGPFPNLPSPTHSDHHPPPLPLNHTRRESCPITFPFPVSPHHHLHHDPSLFPSTSSSLNNHHHYLLKCRLDIRNKNNNDSGLIWPFSDIKIIDDDDIRETAYEVLFTACRSSPGFGGRSALTFYSKHENNGGGGSGGMSPASGPVSTTSRVKQALGLKMMMSSLCQRMISRGGWTAMSVPSSPVTEGSPRSRVLPRRTMSMAEVMRLQMGVSEQSDSRLRKTLMRTLVGQVRLFFFFKIIIFRILIC